MKLRVGIEAKCIFIAHGCLFVIKPLASGSCVPRLLHGKEISGTLKLNCYVIAIVLHHAWMVGLMRAKQGGYRGFRGFEFVLTREKTILDDNSQCVQK